MYFLRANVGSEFHKIYPPDTGFVFGHDPGAALAPDGAFVRADRLPALRDRLDFLDVIPNPVVEIVSP